MCQVIAVCVIAAYEILSSCDADQQVCNNVADGIESVPYHKVFSFGGKRGMMQYMNSVRYSLGLYRPWVIDA